MSVVFLNFLQRWVVTTLAVLLAAAMVPGIRYDTTATLLLASLTLGFLNAFVRPLLLIFSIPLLVFTLGLFIPVLNALLLLFVNHLVRGFVVSGFWSAFWGGIVISSVSIVLNLLLGKGPKFRGSIRRNKPRGNDPGAGSGPVIDV